MLFFQNTLSWTVPFGGVHLVVRWSVRCVWNKCVEMEIQDGRNDRNGTSKPTPQDNGIKSTTVAKSTKFYFGGPTGVLMLMITLPIFAILLNGMCWKGKCTLWRLPELPTKFDDYFFLEGLYYILGFAIPVLLLNELPIGSLVDGPQMPLGKLKKYRLNGIFLSGIIMACIGMFIIVRFPFTLLADKPNAFAIKSIIGSFLFSLFLYYKSFNAPESELNINGNTGNAIYDFFMGRELNPRIGNMDIKRLVMRAGLMIWCAVDVSCLAQQMSQLGSATPTFLIAALGHVLFFLDYLIFEESILTTYAVKHEGLGFMFVFGSVCFMPLVYSLNARYVVENNYVVESEPYVIFLFGFIIVSHGYYRLSNWDKMLFLRYPNHLEVINFDYIEADNGQRILVDGWWVVVRHPNYMADILTSISWCIVTGFADPLPYLYPAFLIVFLLHRIKINEDSCRREFGPAWDTYCERVPYKLIKYVY